MSTNQHPVDMLPANSRRLLCQALVLAGSAAFTENTSKENYWQLVGALKLVFIHELHHFYEFLCLLRFSDQGSNLTRKQLTQVCVPLSLHPAKFSNQLRFVLFYVVLIFDS